MTMLTTQEIMRELIRAKRDGRAIDFKGHSVPEWVEVILKQELQKLYDDNDDTVERIDKPHTWPRPLRELITDMIGSYKDASPHPFDSIAAMDEAGRWAYHAFKRGAQIGYDEGHALGYDEGMEEGLTQKERAKPTAYVYKDPKTGQEIWMHPSDIAIVYPT